MLQKLRRIFRRELTPEELKAREDVKRLLEDEVTLRASQRGGGSWVDPKSGRR